MVPLIRAAQQGGHDVVVSSGADMSALIGRLGVITHRSGVTLAESYERMPGQATISELPAEQQPGFAARHLFGAGAVDRAHDLLDLLQRWRPDLIVHDTLELGSPTAAVVHGIPHVTHGYGPMVPSTSSLAAAIGAAISEAGLPDPTPDIFAAPYLDICPPSLGGTEPSPWTTIHPLRPSPGEPHAAVELDLSALPHPDTVYLTLGTIMNQTPRVFRAVIDGCVRWPVNLVVTTGPGFEPALLGPLPPAVRTASFLPQAVVLPHCRAVVSHAGAGTMLGALCYGLPQLCLPQGTDQPSNTAALLPTGAALALEPDQITADAVAEALGRLLNEPSFRQAATRLRAEIERMPTAAAVLHELLATTDHSQTHSP
jgi:UDP:flavonoid glycosyltransferase YjiC (YdhE family)